MFTPFQMLCFVQLFMFQQKLRNQSPTSLWRCDSSSRTVWPRYLWRQVHSLSQWPQEKISFVLTPGRSVVCCMAIFYSSGSNWRRQRSTQCQKNIDGLEITVEGHLHFRSSLNEIILQFLCLCMPSKYTTQTFLLYTVLVNFCSLVSMGTSSLLSIDKSEIGL